MVLVQSTMLALKTKAPDFSLLDVVSEKKYSLKDFSGKKAMLVMFICRHCPYVQHIKDELGKLGRDFDKSVTIVGISSNDADKYTDDAPESLKEFALEEKYLFPFLYDSTQKVAVDYTAACTPDFFLFDEKNELVYRGQLDDSRPGNGKPVTGKDLRVAIDAVLADKPVSEVQRPSAGCNIKWKPGQEPVYFRG